MSTVEERLLRLEKAVFGSRTEPRSDEWQETVGMFRGDTVMQEIISDIQQARAREREEAIKNS